MTEWILVGVVVLLIGANAIFVAAEFAFITVDRPAVRTAAAAGDRGALSLQRALSKLSTQLSGAQLGITLTSLITGFIAEPSIAALLRGPLQGLGIPESAALATSLTLAFLIATLAQMVFGELVPKNWALAEPLRLGKLVAGPQRFFTFISKPLLFVLQGSSNGLLRLVGVTPQEELEGARTAEELAAMAARSAQEGTLEGEVARRVIKSVRLGDRYASDAMTPRSHVAFLSSDQTVADVLLHSVETGFSRFPVIGESVDEVLGIAHFKDALTIPRADRARTPVTAIIRTAVEVPSAMALDDALEQLRGGLQTAIVVDEYGGTHGLLTLEDIVEELVGEIDDEHDTPVPLMRDLGDGRRMLSGLVRPDEIDDLDLPEGVNSETLGGLIIEELGRFPEVGDTVEIAARDRVNVDDDGLPRPVIVQLTVMHLDDRRIDRLTLQVREPGDADG